MIDDDEQPCVVYIRRNADGVVREKRDLGWFNDYIWREGNFSCDCNRYLFFQRAADEDEVDHPCSDGKYSIRIETLDGRELFRDGTW